MLKYSHIILNRFNREMVNARALHAELQQSQQFSTWIKLKIMKFGFAESKDYITYLQAQSGRGRSPQEFLLELGAALKVVSGYRNTIELADFISARMGISASQDREAYAEIVEPTVPTAPANSSGINYFDFQDINVRVVLDERGDPLFVAKDVAEALEYSWNGTDCIRHVPEEWRRVRSVLTSRGDFIKEMAVLTEQGLYFFLGRSDKPKALPFQKWIAGEVLPSIRKTGSYSIQPEMAEFQRSDNRTYPDLTFQQAAQKLDVRLMYLTDFMCKHKWIYRNNRKLWEAYRDKLQYGFLKFMPSRSQVVITPEGFKKLHSEIREIRIREFDAISAH